MRAPRQQLAAQFAVQFPAATAQAAGSSAWWAQVSSSQPGPSFPQLKSQKMIKRLECVKCVGLCVPTDIK